MSDQIEAAGGKRIEGRDLRAKQRETLEKVIPLPAPLVAYIEPTNLCNFRCQFCPTADPDLLKKVERPKGSMSFELFCRLVDDMKQFDRKLKVVNLYKDGEPLLHRQFPEMVRYLKQADVTERILLKTNGSLLDPELNQRLVAAGPDIICISAEAVSGEGYRKIAGAKIDYDTFRENIRDLYTRRGDCEIHVKLANSGFPPQEIETFYADFEPIATRVWVEGLMGWSYSSVKDFTLGTNPTTFDGTPLAPKLVCPFPFYAVAVNFNGTVSLCCADWSHSTVVGDITQESLPSIWNGPSLFAFRKMHLEGKRGSNRACGDCYYLDCAPDNIDEHRTTILENLARSSIKAAGEPIRNRETRFS